MASTTGTSAPRRADARKNIAAILDAATECLAVDPDASISDIASAAGVGRVTLYGHFPTRAALVGQVVERVMRDSDALLDAVDLEGDARLALGRLLEASWQVTHRYRGLVLAAQAAMPDRDLRQAHDKPTQRMTRLLRRGRREGVVRKDMPVTWQVTTIQGVLHAASAAAHRGELSAEHAPDLIRTTLLAALTIDRT
ncbi:TetR/AcrR family transcriptional regulator [Propionibacteriaceae bacterium Y2011]|uniref:TetR/AcrR family transcriptional regulator n=1 Tax=Microlunatus sp. Y2014 TaxID=3418488 RepID=UPI003B4D607E